MDLPTQEFLESYHQKLLDRARLARLLRERDSRLPKVQDQLLLKAGDSLIALGTHLKTLSQTSVEQPQLPVYKISQQRQGLANGFLAVWARIRWPSPCSVPLYAG